MACSWSSANSGFSCPILHRRTLVPRAFILASIFPALQLSSGLKARSRKTATSSGAAQEANELVEWIIAGGGHCESVQIAVEEKKGQTLVAANAVEKGRLLVGLPKSRQLSTESTDNTLQTLIDDVPSDLWAAKLALPLIAERAKGTNSKFLPYLQSLPVGISGLPIFYQPEEIKQLQYPPLIQQVNLRCRWLLKFAPSALGTPDAKQCFAGLAIDANLLGWGLGCASSRAFKVGQGSAPSMLPLIDLCNHSFTPNCKLEGSADGAARLVACQDIAAQEPLNIDYGKLSNTTLLQDYGFIVPENPFDSVQMMVSADQIQVAQALGGVGIPKEPEQWQALLLDKLGVSGKGCSMDLCRSSPMFDWRLVAATRVLCASAPGELKGRDLVELGDMECPLTRKLELKAMKTLAAMCAQLISAMGTKLEDDKRLLSQSQALSHNTRLALQYRVQLKIFIQAAMALVLNRLKELHSVT